MTGNVWDNLKAGQVIPACPLLLYSDRRWAETYQRGVIRYYLDAGAGGLAVGVHSTQFEIREPQYGLFEPVLRLASETVDRHFGGSDHGFIKVAGLCGDTAQAVKEAELARELGYHAGLLSLAGWGGVGEKEILAHCVKVAEVLPLFGFYLQPAVGGRHLSYRFWRGLADLKRLVAIKVAPFNRYHTADVVRAIADAGRDDVALYTGNDDHIIADLITPFRLASTHGGSETQYMAGGLLGQWGIWTQKAVECLRSIQASRHQGWLSSEWLTWDAQLTDANGAIFDAANGFRGCLPGILEVLRRQGLAPSNVCLNPELSLSPGQADEITRVASAYPHLTDDAFVAANRATWLE